MKKLLFRAAMATGTLGVIVAGAAAFSAFEAHVVNVTATIANATDISTEALTFGNVFPQEILHLPVTLSLSDSFLSQDNTLADTVSYMIKQKPKCAIDENGTGDPYAQVSEDEKGNFICPTGYHKMELLCPYLSKTSERQTDVSVPSFHGPTTLADWTDQVSFDTRATGVLNKSNATSTTWDIDLHTPCFQGQCAQDWASYVHKANASATPEDYMADPSLQGKPMGCDLWFELTGVNG